MVPRLEDVRWYINECQSEYLCWWFRDLKMLDDVLMNINHNTCVGEDLKMLDDILMNVNQNTCVGGSETWRC